MLIQKLMARTFVAVGSNLLQLACAWPSFELSIAASYLFCELELVVGCLSNRCWQN